MVIVSSGFSQLRGIGLNASTRAKGRKGCGVSLHFRHDVMSGTMEEGQMRWKSIAGLLVLGLLASACAYQPPPTGGAPLPGFLLGLLHGYISFFSLIGSLFLDIRIYAFPNNGFFYDLGFVIGLFALDRKSTRLNSSHANISY